MKELKEMLESIRGELEELYNGNWTDEEREEREENGDPCDLYEYFYDVLDIEYTISSRGDYLGASIWITLGGPNIWIDTRENEIKGRWGSDAVNIWLPSEISNEIDAIFEEYYNCIKRGLNNETTFN